jgi:hypothetical protein
VRGRDGRLVVWHFFISLVVLWRVRRRFVLGEKGNLRCIAFDGCEKEVSSVRIKRSVYEQTGQYKYNLETKTG